MNYVQARIKCKLRVGDIVVHRAKGEETKIKRLFPCDWYFKDKYCSIPGGYKECQVPIMFEPRYCHGDLTLNHIDVKLKKL